MTQPMGSVRVPLPKVKSYVTGLDDVLEGGLPKGRTTIISGGPGCGKSILGIEFLYRSALEGHSGIFVTFEEKANAVRQNAATLGWELKPLENNGLFFILEAYVDPKTLIAGSFSLDGLLAIIEGQSKTLQCDRIVIDAVDILLRLYNDPAKERTELYALYDWLSKNHYTTLMTSKTPQGKDTPIRYEFLDFMADCVIHLDQRVSSQITTRRLRVTKYRGSGFGRNEYPYVISDEGISIIPISTAGLRHKPLGEVVSSGNKKLDIVLGGGYRRCSCVLISGITGAGKTTIANTFIQNVCQSDERVLYIGFEESVEAIVNNMLSPGIDLRPAIDNQKLKFLTAMPESMGAEEHLVRAIKMMQHFSPNHIIVDAISACYRMGTSQIAFEYIMRLLNYCKERDITCLLLNQTVKAMDIHQISGMEISSMVDTAIYLGMVEIGGELNRVLLVLKSRGLSHSNQYREFLITDNGIDLIDIFVGEGGVLTGTARQEQEAKEEANKRIREQTILKKKHELNHKMAEKEARMASLQSDIDIINAELETLLEEERIWENNRQIRGNLRGQFSENKQTEY